MNNVKNSVWNGLVNFDYSFIVCRLKEQGNHHSYNWIAIYDTKKRIIELSKDTSSWEIELNKIFNPFLFRDKGKFVMLKFSSEKIKKNFEEEPYVELLNKEEIFFDSMDEIIVFLNNSKIDLDWFTPPHTEGFPMNYMTWGQNTD